MGRSSKCAAILAFHCWAAAKSGTDCPTMHSDRRLRPRVPRPRLAKRNGRQRNLTGPPSGLHHSLLHAPRYLQLLQRVMDALQGGVPLSPLVDKRLARNQPPSLLAANLPPVRRINGCSVGCAFVAGSAK